jgi:hypothetical protein
VCYRKHAPPWLYVPVESIGAQVTSLACNVPLYLGRFTDAKRHVIGPLATGSFRPRHADLCSRIPQRIAQLSETSGRLLAVPSRDVEA